MGIFVNPGNVAFQVALNSEIYVDKTGLLKLYKPCHGYDFMSLSVTVARADLENPLLQICLLPTMAGDAIRKPCFLRLEIGKNAEFQRHLNQYDVIHLDIQWCL